MNMALSPLLAIKMLFFLKKYSIILKDCQHNCIKLLKVDKNYIKERENE